MTEHEWLICTDPQLMLNALRLRESVGGTPGPLISNRKLRLFACACCRLNGCKDNDIDGYENGTREPPITSLTEWANAWASQPTWLVKQETKTALLREIVGNPFRPVITAEGERWITTSQKSFRYRTPTVIAIAKAIHDERAFDRMPILGDALEDASCGDQDVLEHCRLPCPFCKDATFTTADYGGLMGGGNRKAQTAIARHLNKACACKGSRTAMHVRGCWVLDLILGEDNE